MSIGAALDRVEFRCLCCGASSQGGKRDTCECWSGVVDRCERGPCAEHCKCPRCKANRKSGWERVNWTGTRHFARVGQPRTLCGATIGTGQVWRRPMLRAGQQYECRRCLAAWERLHASKENDG